MISNLQFNNKVCPTRTQVIEGVLTKKECHIGKLCAAFQFAQFWFTVSKLAYNLFVKFEHTRTNTFRQTVSLLENESVTVNQALCTM